MSRSSTIGVRARDDGVPAARPILVTGSHRSGSTWVGQTLAAAPDVGYVHEPFNLNHRLDLFRADVRYWFRYVESESAESFRTAFTDTLAFRYPMLRKLATARGPREVRTVWSYLSRYHRYRKFGCRPLIKDPLAVLSAEWLANTFDMDVVVVVRHPAAFTYSLLRAGWTHPFEHFLAQPQLMQDLLLPYENEIASYAERPRPIFDQAILLWRIIHHSIRTFRDRQPRWNFVRHMDLSIDPLQEFESLFKKLDLGFTEQVQAIIAAQTGSLNPAEAEGLFDLRRDSQKSIFSWTHRLTASQVSEIRDRTADVWPAFYSDRDWQPLFDVDRFT